MSDSFEMYVDWCVQCGAEHSYMNGDCDTCGQNTFSKTKPVNSFTGEYEFLSNFYEGAPIEMFDGLVYKTTEHAYQAHKTHNMEERKRVAAMSTPGKAKRAGKHVWLRDDWEDVKISIMEGIVQKKFLTHFDLKDKLLATGNAHLIEGNTWNDPFWGVYKGQGTNHLGQILMKIRNNLNINGSD